MRLSPHCEALLQEFIDLRPQLIQLDNKVFELLQTTMQQQGIDFTDGLDAAEMAQLAGSFLSGQTTEQAAQSTGIDLGTVANIASLFLGK